MHLRDGYGAEMDEKRQATKGALRGERHGLAESPEGRLTASGAADRPTCDAPAAGRVIKRAARRLAPREDGLRRAAAVPTSHCVLRQVPSSIGRVRTKDGPVVSAPSDVHGGKPTLGARGRSVRDTATAGSVGDAGPSKKPSLSRALFSAMLDVFGPKPGLRARYPDVACTSSEKISPLDSVLLPHKLAKRLASSAEPCSTVAAAGQPGQSSWDASDTAAPDSEPFIEDVEMEDLSDALDKSSKTQGLLSDYKGTYVVTDTNIFLGKLNLVKKIVEPCEGAEDMIVFIPWIAIQELDNIKTKKKGMLSKKAIAAIAYIYKALASKNPRLRGQTIAEARSKDDALPKDDCDINDDHFLHCCFTLLGQGNRVLLVTDDRNLRNKAMINFITTVPSHELETRLNGPNIGRQQIPQPAPLAGHLLTAGKPPAHTYLVCDRDLQGVCLDEKAVRAEACDILRKSLSLVLENELECAFGDLWPRVVFISPPWSELTALECLLKHWIALRGTAFKSSLKPTMVQLVDILKYPTASSGELSCLLNLSFTVCSELQLHYNQLAEGVARLGELYTAITTEQPRSPKPTSGVMGISGENSSCIRVHNPLGNREGGGSQRAPSSPPNPAAQLLDDLWPLINDYCGNISQLVGMEHPFAYVERPSFILDWFTVMDVYQRVTLTMRYMGSLLNRSIEEREILVGLAKTFVTTLVELAKLLLHKAGLPDVEWNVTEEDMLDHLLDTEKKNTMAVGHRQIVALNNMLRCIVHFREPVSAEPPGK